MKLKIIVALGLMLLYFLLIFTDSHDFCDF